MDVESQWYFSNTVIKFYAIFSSFLVGLGAGPLWVSQAYHINSCASESNKGMFNGIFFGLFTIASLVTNALAAFLTIRVSKVTFYFIMSCIVLGAVLIFLLGIRKPTQKLQLRQEVV